MAVYHVRVSNKEKAKVILIGCFWRQISKDKAGFVRQIFCIQHQNYETG